RTARIESGLFPELANGGLKRIFAGMDAAFWNCPRTLVAGRPIGPAGRGQQHFDLSIASPVQQQPGTFLLRHLSARIYDRYCPAVAVTGRICARFATSSPLPCARSPAGRPRGPRETP